MLTFLSIPYLALFLAGTASQLAVIFLLWKHRAFSEYPLFSLCIAGQTAAGFIAMMAWKVSPMAYLAIYYVATISSGILILLAAGEVCAKVFGPRIGVPQWAQTRLAIFAGMSVATAVSINVIWHPLNGGTWNRALNVAEQDLTTTAWAVFSILWVYSHRLGISWRPRLQGITLGFVLYLSINMAAILVRSRWPLAVMQYAAQIGIAAYLVSLLVWGKTFWAVEPAREPATDEMMEEFGAHHCANMEALGKLTTLSN